jgi:hypothetical protein
MMSVPSIAQIDAAIEHLKTSPRCAFPDETVFSFTDVQHDTILFALNALREAEQKEKNNETIY